MARRCSRLYIDPAAGPLLTDACGRDEHDDPIHTGRHRDVEWTGSGRKSTYVAGTKLKREAQPEGPLEPRLPLDEEAA